MTGTHFADHATLVALAAEAGFPVDVARSLLRGDDYAEAVRADEGAARRHGLGRRAPRLLRAFRKENVRNRS
ncbi:hypothetical protein Aros01_06421 [Streptosporangium roseum]